jgi:hypothetical protein
VVKLPEARITHTISGRLRIKIPLKKGDTSYFESLEQKFSGCDKVQKVEANVVTAGVLFLHDSDTRDISKFAEENRLFRVETLERKQTPLANRMRSSFLSIYQIARGNFYAPAWYSSLWYGLNIVFKSSDTRT